MGGHDDDIARIDRASGHLGAARVHLEKALEEVHDAIFDSVPDWVVDELNETLKPFGLFVIPRRRVG